MGRKLLELFLQSLQHMRVFVVGEVPAPRRTYYFSMNPADGKMVRKTVSHARGKRKKSR